MGSTDLRVDPISSALAGKTIEVVVSGSIGAVESVRFVRALRRLGANVVPWLTDGGAQFITETSLAWAAAAPVRRYFSGDATHIASADACVVAPASASIIAKVAHGITDSPASTLITSYLGMQKPVFVVPNMHDSLAAAPASIANLNQLKNWLTVLDTRQEEGKRKFPDPSVLADQVAHHLRRSERPKQPVLVTLGSTRGFIDDVRYISNLSSGRLGSLICNELYRFGYSVHAVCGSRQHSPTGYTQAVSAQTNEAMRDACKQQVAQGICGLVMTAAALDFIPTKKLAGKIDSKATKTLSVEFSQADKIISEFAKIKVPKIAFKLTDGLSEEAEEKIAKDYLKNYDLTLLVHNRLREIDTDQHHAQLYFGSALSTQPDPVQSKTKSDIARLVVQHMLEQHAR